jgi:hypothetical protein
MYGHSRSRSRDRRAGSQAGSQEGAGSDRNQAVRKELDGEEKKLSLWERTADIRAELNANADPDFTPDKAFFDWLSGEEDD